jgi:predicted HTH domain antitoxin
METIAQSLSGTDRPLVAAFGTLAMKPGRLATEDKAYDPESVGATRAKAEDTMRELAARCIRTSVIRLPPLGRAANLAGVPVGQMMTILTEFGVESRIEDEDYLQGLDEYSLSN